jgi:hypothetical protein
MRPFVVDTDTRRLQLFALGAIQKSTSGIGTAGTAGATGRARHGRPAVPACRHHLHRLDQDLIGKLRPLGID